MLVTAHEHGPTHEPYSPGVSALLSLGEKPLCQKEWADYLAMGIEEGDVAELIRMALDSSLGMDESKPDEAYGPVHAWRALGQLRAVEAIAPLLRALRDNDEDDWAIEDIPVALGKIGPAALPLVAALLANSNADSIVRSCAGTAIKHLAQRYPEASEECISALVCRLKDPTEKDEELNGSVVSTLVDLKAAAALPIIQRAFDTERVCEAICGDWEDVQIAFGLKAEREHPPNYRWELRRTSESNSTAPPKLPKSKAKLKAERRARRGKEKKKR